MDPEIKKALANIRRRQSEIDRKFGKTEDDGPLFDRGKRARQERSRLDEEVDVDLMEDLDDGMDL